MALNAKRARTLHETLELSDSRQRAIPSNFQRDSARMTAEPMELQDVQSSRTFRVQRHGRYLVVGAAALATLVLAGSWVLRHSAASSAPMSVAQRVSPKAVMFEVQALPADAEILLDGKPLGTNHFAGTRPFSERKVSLEVRATGHLTERKELVFTRDMSLQIMLAPDPALPATSAPTAAHVESAAPNPKLAAQGPSRVIKKPSGKCNPPYVFAADGVKTYKPECF